MKNKKYKIFTVLLIGIIITTTLMGISIARAESIDKLVNEIDRKVYVVRDEAFQRGFFGTINQKITCIMDKSFKYNKSTIYNDTIIKKIIINNESVEAEEIKNSSNILKEVYNKRNKDLALDDIKIVTNDREIYSYKEYLDLKIKNAKPINIAFDTTWTKAEGPYYIGGEVRVLNGATLTIEEGTEVYFYNTPSTENKSGILVDGNLIINGTSLNKVTFKPYGENNESGSWKGIYVTERGNIKVSYANIDKAGAWTNSAIYSYGNLNLNNVSITNTLGTAVTAFKDVKITNSNLNNNSKYGLDIYRNIKDYSTVITNNKINNNNGVGKLTYRQANSSNFNVTGNIATANEINGVKLCGDILGDITFTNIGTNIPYIIVNKSDLNTEITQFTINKNSTVTFDKTIVKVEKNPSNIKGNRIVVDGDLNIIGTATNPSIITSLLDNTIYSNTVSASEVSNIDWEGIYAKEDTNININYGEIRYAQNAISTFGALKIESSKINNSFMGIYSYNNNLTVKKCTFDKLEKNAFIYNSAGKEVDITLQNNIFSNINDTIGKLILYKSGGVNLNLNGNIASNVKKNGVQLNADIEYNTKFNNIGNDIPYIVSDLKIRKEATVNVDAGTIFKFEDGVFLGEKSGVITNGKLMLNGVATNPIVFTSLKDDSIGGDSNGDGTSTTPSNGDWGAVVLDGDRGTTNASVFNYTNIKYGGDNKRGYLLGGTGSLTVNNSSISNSSEDGISVTGDLSLNSSKILDNSKNGIRIKSSSNFNIVLNNNTFRNNSLYAGFMSFGSSKDKFSGVNNIAINNGINGVGLEGVLSNDFTLSPAGNNFPYVVPNELMVESAAKLTLAEGTIIKFGQDAKLNLKGKLDVNGTEAKKVYYMSLKDDSIGGDTNNDGTATSSEYGSWQGIVYSPGSEGEFSYFKSLDSKYNMDYDNINTVKAEAKGNSKVSTYEGMSVFIKQSGDISSVDVYNSTTRESITISSSKSDKRSPMIWANYVAWIEGGNINLYNLSTKTKNYINTNGIIDFYLNDGYLVWHYNSSLQYVNLSNINNKITISNVSKSLKPVISSRYILYQNSKDNLVHRVDIATGKEYYMFTNKASYSSADMYGDNILFMSKNASGVSDNIIVGDIPSWTASDVTDNIYFKNYHGALYKDLVSYYNNGGSEDNNIIIKESLDDGAIKTLSKLTIGYEITGNDIGNGTSIFTDNTNVYIVDTKIQATKTYFVQGDRYNDTKYDRTMSLGNTLGLSIGAEADAGIVSGGISLNSSRTANLIYGLNKNSSDLVRSITLGRELIKEFGVEAEAEVGVGKEIGKGEVKAVLGSVSSSLSGLTKGSDSFTFDSMDIETYKKIGLLTGALLAKYGESDLISINKVILNLIAKKLEAEANPVDTSLAYNMSNGIGINYELSSGIGANASFLGSSLGVNSEASINSNALGEVGIEKDVDGLTNSYINFINAYEASFSSGLNIDIGFEKEFEDESSIGFQAKIPDDFFRKDQSSKIRFEMKLKERGVLEVTFSDEEEDENGFVKTYSYIIQGADYNYIKVNKLLAGISDLENNLNSLEPYSLKLGAYVINNDVSIFKNINDLIELLKNCNAVEYKISLSKGIEKELDLSIDSSDIEIQPGIKPTLGIAMSGAYEDKTSLVVDSGIINKGKVSYNEVVMAFIPVENTSALKILKNSVAAFVSQISPTEVKYKNNVAIYESDNNKVSITANNGGLYKTIFIKSPIDIEGTFDSGIGVEVLPNNYLIKDSIYFESVDTNKEVITSYPSETKLKMYVGSNWSDVYKDKYAIYKYDMENKIWIKIGGKIDITEKSVEITIDSNGQYALGIDNNSKMTWRDASGNELTKNTTYSFAIGDNISIEINGHDNYANSRIIVTDFNTGQEINQYTSSSNLINHTISGEKSKKYKLIIEYIDLYENTYSETIFYTV